MPSATARVAPIRSLIRPASGSPVTDPMLAANRVSPSWPAVRPSASFASAIREAQDAKTSPARAKMTKTDVRARMTRSRGIVGVGVVMAGVADNAVSSAGVGVDLGVESIRSNRFDIVSPVTPARQTTAARRPTLRDVARRAGVSTSTASLVFSGKGPVATATAERVRTAATDLAYAGPDPLASSLRQGRVGTVAVVVEGPLRYAFHDPFALAVLDGLAEELDAAGRSMLLVAQPVEDPERAVAQLATQAVDAAVFPLCGEVVNPVRRPPAGPRRARGGQRRAGAPAGGPRAHRRGGRDAAHDPARARARPHPGRPPVDAAHEPARDGAGPLAGWVTEQDVAQAAYPDAAGRLAGFRSLAGDDAPVVQAHDLTVEAGEAAARLLLDVPASRRPTAVVAQADLLAAGVVRAAEALGLRVPQDLSVTGFDGVDLPWLDHVLTTVEQPGAAKGRAMGRLVRLRPRGPPDRRRAVPGTPEGGDDLVVPTLGHPLRRRWSAAAARAALVAVDEGADPRERCARRPWARRSRQSGATAWAPSGTSAEPGYRSSVPAASNSTWVDPALL